MSVLEPQQFTPAQVLEAGRRAETEGRGEYAIQFYRHIVDSYPGTGEAVAAQSALTRIISQLPQSSPHQLGAPPVRVAGPSEPRLELPGTGPSFNNPFDQHSPYQPQFGASSYGAGPTPSPAGYSEQAAAESGDPRLDAELPEQSSDYLTGRILARLFAWIGGLIMLGGFGVIPASILMPRLVQQIPFLPSPAIAGAITAVLGGMLIIMLSQLVRALLDQANAARDVATVTRARAEARPQRHKKGRRR